MLLMDCSGGAGFDAEAVSRCLNCPLEAVADEYLAAIEDPKYTHLLESPVLFWRAIRIKEEQFRTNILDCLLMPVAVTTCDSVFSVEAALFTTQQVRLNRTKAATLLQIRANGDLEGVLPQWARRGFHGNAE